MENYEEFTKINKYKFDHYYLSVQEKWSLEYNPILIYFILQRLN